MRGRSEVKGQPKPAHATYKPQHAVSYPISLQNVHETNARAYDLGHLRHVFGLPLTWLIARLAVDTSDQSAKDLMCLWRIFLDDFHKAGGQNRSC